MYAVEAPQYQEGKYAPTEDRDNPAQRFGHANSCPALYLRGVRAQFLHDPCDGCVCPPRPDWGGGKGYSGGVRNMGDSPFRQLQPYLAECDFGGTFPTGTNGSDAENWAN